MPTWGEILKEVAQSKTPTGGPDFDSVRRKYLRAVHDLTGRAVILYTTAFLESRPILPSDLQIGLVDMQGLMEVVSNITERDLDLILHSPGGSAEAAESMVAYLRKRFDHIRVFVPVAAMSAATMVALAADEIVMGQHSQLGPIDPQFIISTPEGPRSAPAKAILDQFELAKEQCKDPSNLAAWMPILRSYAPGLLKQCQDSQTLARTMVSNWLRRYMFAGSPEAEGKAGSVAAWFANYDNFKSHGRRVGPEQAAEVGVRVTRLEDDHGLQDAVLSVHHAAMHTFAGTPATKIIENHHGRAWIRSVRQVVVQAPPAQAPPDIPGSAPLLNRAERRRLDREGKR
ncbi:MAG: serine protease [Chloroflexi bacterium]|nr:serine protease [Chloroflexota bacterium]